MKYTPAHEITRGLGKVSPRAFSFFHALRKCDTTSAVAGKGKMSFYHMWSFLPDIATVFDKLENIAVINQVTENELKTVE